jgi:hypothetical protein
MSNFGCDDRGPRGKRGERGERGERGKHGKTGPTGPTGTTGSLSGAQIGRWVFETVGSFTYTPTPGTRRAIVRGAGGGGGGGGVAAAAAPNDAGAASGGNSGVAIEVEIVAPPNTFLTGGPGVVGAAGPGMIGNGAVSSGQDSTVLIGGVLLTAPGGVGGNTAGSGAPTPNLNGPNPQLPATGVDYSAADLGGVGFALSTASTSIRGGDGGSGDYGIAGRGGFQAANGENASGQGAGGGGAAQSAGGTSVFNGGAGSPGFWIIEDYS